MWFPIDQATATQNSAGTSWVITFGPYKTDRVIRWIAIAGGHSSASVTVYMDSIFIDATVRGDLNVAEYKTGIPLARGRQLILTWSNILLGPGYTSVTATIAADDGAQSLGGGPTIFQSGN